MMINTIANKYGVDPDLVSAFCLVESANNPWAFRFEPSFKAHYIDPLKESHILSRNPIMKTTRIPTMETERVMLSTSWGLMQILGQTAREFGFRGQFLSELCHPEVGLEYGVQYLAKKIQSYSNIEDAISAYNAGVPITRNRPYVDRILKACLNTP